MADSGKAPVTDDEPRKCFECPISLQRLVDPVVGPDGWTYSRDAIEQWLGADQTSPMTKQRMAIMDLVSNILMRHIIKQNIGSNTVPSVEMRITSKLRDRMFMHPLGRLMCPISNVVFTDPVVAADGHTYEKKSIEKWFEVDGLVSMAHSPRTGYLLENHKLRPNRVIRDMLCLCVRQPSANEGPAAGGSRKRKDF